MSFYSFQGHTRVWTPRDEEENRAIFSSRRKETGITMPNEFKPIYLANAEYEVEKWGINRLIRLLRLYGSHRVLWDINDPDYRSRELRKAAIIDITAAMGDGVTQEQVIQKINVLRATYRYEKKRIKQRIKNGIGAKTKLKWFALADSFLRHVPKAEKFRKNQEGDSDSDLENTVVFTIDPETIIPFDEDQEMCSQNLNRIKDEPLDIDNALFNETPTIVKHEFPTAEVSLPNSTKPIWTSRESLQFVELFGQHPILWPLNEEFEFDHHNTKDAVIEIANAMQMPLQRIEKRVHIFRRTWRNEQAKMLQNPNYKPQYVWWHMAAKYIQNAGIHQFDCSEHFVDTNKLPPATPLNKYYHETKQEIHVKADATSMNAVPNATMNVTCVNDCSSSHTEEKNKNETHATTAKLIWNGLEDDLLDGKWSLKHSVKFLRLYGAHRCLWDLNDVDFRSRELRNAAIEDMAAAMGHGLTADYVAKKIKIFRITYMQHRKRMLEAIKMGKQPEIQLRWFPLADSFLRPHIGLRCIKEHEREMQQFDFQYVYANLNLIDPALLTDFRGKGTQNTIEIGDEKFTTTATSSAIAEVAEQSQTSVECGTP